MSDRLNAVVSFCGRPVIPDVHTTDGPSPNRSNSFAICTVMDPVDGKTVLRNYRGPDTYRQFVAWKKLLLGFPFLVKSYFCGTVVSARRVDPKGECHVC